MGVSRRKDEFGEEFAHEVNGVRIFAMGADYIPEDNLLPRVNGERTRHLLEACRDAHFNVIRVWGGGYYPDDFFYDICDELGLVVWQDFMFACCVYAVSYTHLIHIHMHILRTIDIVIDIIIPDSSHVRGKGRILPGGGDKQVAPVLEQEARQSRILLSLCLFPEPFIGGQFPHILSSQGNRCV